MRNIFSVFKIGLDAKDDVAGSHYSTLKIEKEIKKLEESSASRCIIVIGDFSQGSTIDLLAAYQNTSTIFEGHAILSELLGKSENTLVAALKETPLLWGHGKYYDKVLFDLHKIGAKKIKEQRINVEACSYPMHHSVCP